MAEPQQTNDPINWEVDKTKLPETLNVLTILTFVGSGLGLISSLYGFFHAQESFDKMEQMQGNLDNAPDFMKKFAGPEMLEMLRKSVENRLPIMLLSVAALLLCIYGAIQMRQRKKLGFAIYTIGELLPIATSFIFVGLGVFGGWTLAVTLVFPAVFIILYATQLKNLS
jgi:hypothetical protein